MRAFIAIILVLSLTQCFTAPPINGTLLDLNDYMNGIWGYFNLNQSEAIDCYNGVSAENYFQFLQAEYNLAQAYAQGDFQNVQEYVGLLVALNLTLWQNNICVQNTNDWNDLLLAAGADPSNKTLLLQLEHLYFQAHLNDWGNAYTIPYDDLVNAEYNQAGFAYGPIFKIIWQNSSVADISYLQVKSLQNGVFFYWNLTSPTQIPNCYNETSATWDVDFITGWANVVNNSTLANVASNTNDFFSNTAPQWITPLSESAWACANTTNDNIALTKAVGQNILTPEFQTGILNYVGNQTVNYFLLFTEIYTALSSNNPQYAGLVLGQFYDAVAASMSN